jgi:hypothetical protein
MTTPSSRIIDAVRELSNALQNAGLHLTCFNVAPNEVQKLADQLHRDGYDTKYLEVGGLHNVEISGVPIRQAYVVKWGERE